MRIYDNPSKTIRDQLCRRPALEQASLDILMDEIFEAVRKDGDRALIRYTEKFDNITPQNVALSLNEQQAIALRTPKALMRAIDRAYDNIRVFHAGQVLDQRKETVEILPGVTCWRESRAIERVGLYVPGGTAPLISSALMLGVPAQIAGCKEIILCTPPNKLGAIEPAVCYAAAKIGAKKLMCVGGAQAIAAMAIGTKCVPGVDKIFGPGNQYVTAAKQMAVKYGVAIDMPAGPSEVMVVADETARPDFVAADLLSQAEHGTDSQVVLLATCNKIAKAVNDEMSRQLATLPRKLIADKALTNSFCLVLDTIDKMVNFANNYAPEHLILSVALPEQLATQVANAGSVFLGNYSPESAGDYASGTNHTLPTNGWARSYGGVSLDSFIKKITFQTITQSGLRSLAEVIVPLANAENLSAHARAVTIRLRNNL